MPAVHRARRVRRGALGLRMGLFFVGLLLAVGISRIAGPRADADQVANGSRSLLVFGESVTCSSSFDQDGGIVVYILGVLFMFTGLAIICDDYFVSSLEKLSEKLKLSEDVAGATFMAAGSSAPELFTSLVSVFGPENDIGIGTIVGSAVFNILVIIGATAVLSGQVLVLDYRPLARDCICYVLSVCFLAYTFEDNKIQMEEGLILVIGYILYIVLMYFNPRIMEAIPVPAHIQARDAAKRGSAALTSMSRRSVHEQTNADGNNADSAKPSNKDDVNYDDGDSDGPQGDAAANNEEDPNYEVGKVKRVVSQKDLVSMRLHAAHDAVTNPDGEHHVHLPSDAQGGGGTRKSNVVHPDPQEPSLGAAADPVLAGLEDDIVNSAAAASGVGPDSSTEAPRGDGEAIPEEAAKEIAEKSKEKAPSVAADVEAAAGAEGDGDDDDDDEPLITMPTSITGWAALMFTVWFQIAFAYTVPNCGKKKWEEWYLATFVLSIGWIGFLTWYMVDWASRIGCILDIREAVMGLTFLAAGTSVPDALGSIIVAKDGYGDMAVSNAIGSNVFDILLGLGLPWFLYNVINDRPVAVTTEGIVVYTIVLLGILFVMVGILWFKKWHLDPSAGKPLISVYVLFLVFAFLTGFDVIKL